MEASQIAKLPPQSLKQILLYLYGHQTPQEQGAETTVELNGVGFNRIDADILSSYAQQVLEGRELSEKQFTVMRLRLPKYYRQVNGGNWEAIGIPTIRYTNGSKSKYAAVTVKFGEAFTQTPSTNKIVNADYTEVENLLNDEPSEIKVGDTVVMKKLPSPILDKQTAGLLFIDTEGRMAFKPNVYPSKQIKDLGFNFWDGKAWHQSRAKLYPTIVDDVKKMFGEISIDPSIEEALKPAEPIHLPSWVDEHFQTLHPFQKEAIQFTASHNRLLLALAPRLGKTVVTVISADVVEAKHILVIAPLSLLRDWQKKIRTWSPSSSGDKDVAIVYKKNLVTGARWTITNYDTLRLHPETFKLTPWDLIIVDETLLIKNRSAKRTQWIFELINKKMAYSKRKLKEKGDQSIPDKSIFDNGVAKPKYVWFLSGAPTSKMYTDMWAQLNALDPKEFSSYWKFAEKYCIVQADQWTQYKLVANKPDADKQIKSDLSHIFYTRSHTDVTDMPPLLPENLGVEMSGYQDKMYGQMEADFLAELPEDEHLLAPNILSQMTRLVQIASNPLLIGGKDDGAKWRALVEMLEYEPSPTIVWTSFIETVSRLKEALSKKDIRVATLTGATRQEDRGKIVEAFQNDKVDVLLAHPAVGKFGLDLFNAKSMIYLERGYNADDYYQSQMRVRFVDQKVAPHMVHLLSERKDGSETIDHVIDQILANRTLDTKKLTTVGLKEMMGVTK
jgi:SNF2 family DNA or RNA helicase